MDESLRRTVHKGPTKVERNHKFAKHLAFGAGGHLRSDNPADQEKAIIYNELVTNVVASQTVVGQTQALYTLRSKGVNICTSDLAFLSPYATSKLKRFGDDPTDMNPEGMSTRMTLRLWCLVDVAGFYSNLADRPNIHPLTLGARTNTLHSALKVSGVAGTIALPEEVLTGEVPP